MKKLQINISVQGIISFQHLSTRKALETSILVQGKH